MNQVDLGIIKLSIESILVDYIEYLKKDKKLSSERRMLRKQTVFSFIEYLRKMTWDGKWDIKWEGE